MRLSDILSQPPSEEFKQIEGFIGKQRLRTGKTRNVNIGSVGLNFFCKECQNIRTFNHTGIVQCIGINDKLISVDVVLKCPCCNATVPVWFLVESYENIISNAPQVRILKYSNKLSEKVCINQYFLEYSELLDKAERAYREELGAGATIYLRKLFEQITVQMAHVKSINTKKENGMRKNFKDLLKEVDTVSHIIPTEFSANGYRLFSDLSNFLHNDASDIEALNKYEALKRLIMGILDNMKNNAEIMTAVNTLGWHNGE